MQGVPQGLKQPLTFLKDTLNPHPLSSFPAPPSPAASSSSPSAWQHYPLSPGVQTTLPSSASSVPEETLRATKPPPWLLSSSRFSLPPEPLMGPLGMSQIPEGWVIRHEGCRGAKTTLVPQLCPRHMHRTHSCPGRIGGAPPLAGSQHTPHPNACQSCPAQP